MYEKNEKPTIGVSIVYYDNNFDEALAKKVLTVLKKHNMYPPKKINAGKLTNDKFIKADDKTDDIFVKAYSTRDVYGIVMINGDITMKKDYVHFIWFCNFFKNCDTPPNLSYQPWNAILIYSTYDRLKDASTYSDFIGCVKDIISEVKPFFASIDDTANKVDKSDPSVHERFNKETLPKNVYWGNYLCEYYVEKVNKEAFEYLRQNGGVCESIANGMFFCMSESVFDFKSSSVRRLERRFKRKMKK